MGLRGKAMEIMESLFTERRKAVIRGRQEGPRRPERASRFAGSGYKGPGGQMQGKWVSGEKQAPEIPRAKDLEKKDAITEFDSMEDWMLSMILVAVMHANSEMDADAAIKEGKSWVKKLYMPRTEHLWRKQTTRIKRSGLRAEASKIRREMFKLI